MMNNTPVKLALLLLILMISMGCSSGTSQPTLPESINQNPVDVRQPDSARTLWGLWNITFDPDEMKLGESKEDGQR